MNRAVLLSGLLCAAAGCLDVDNVDTTLDSCAFSVQRPILDKSLAHIEIRSDCVGIVDVEVSAASASRGKILQSLWANELCPVHFRLDLSAVPDDIRQFFVVMQPHSDTPTDEGRVVCDLQTVGGN